MSFKRNVSVFFWILCLCVLDEMRFFLKRYRNRNQHGFHRKKVRHTRISIYIGFILIRCYQYGRFFSSTAIPSERYVCFFCYFKLLFRRLFNWQIKEKNTPASISTNRYGIMFRSRWKENSGADRSGMMFWECQPTKIQPFETHFENTFIHFSFCKFWFCSRFCSVYRWHTHTHSVAPSLSDCKEQERVPMSTSTASSDHLRVNRCGWRKKNRLCCFFPLLYQVRLSFDFSIVSSITLVLLAWVSYTCRSDGNCLLGIFQKNFVLCVPSKW